MTDNRELDDTVVVDQLRPNEEVCPTCWLVYNAAHGDCLNLDCEP